MQLESTPNDRTKEFALKPKEYKNSGLLLSMNYGKDTTERKFLMSGLSFLLLWRQEKRP